MVDFIHLSLLIEKQEADIPGSVICSGKLCPRLRETAFAFRNAADPWKWKRCLRWQARVGACGKGRNSTWPGPTLGSAEPKLQFPSHSGRRWGNECFLNSFCSPFKHESTLRICLQAVHFSACLPHQHLLAHLWAQRWAEAAIEVEERESHGGQPTQEVKVQDVQDVWAGLCA